MAFRLFALAALTIAPNAWANDGSLSLEGTVGRQSGFSLFADLALKPDTVYLNAGYSLVKPPDVPGESDVPPVAAALSHQVLFGVDVSFAQAWTISSMVTVGPKAMESVDLNPRSTPDMRLGLRTSHSNIGGSVLAVYDSGGWSDFEWSLDAGFTATANWLGRALTLAGRGLERSEILGVLRPSLGLTLTGWRDNDFSVRGSFTAYTADPLTVGRFNLPDLAELARLGFANFGDALARASLAAQAMQSRFGQADALSGYLSAPVWFEVKSAYTHRFERRVSLTPAYTFIRYLPTQGRGHLASLRLSLRLTSSWRLWLSGSVQFDEPLDKPGQRGPEDPLPSTGWLTSMGVEWTHTSK